MNSTLYSRTLFPLLDLEFEFEEGLEPDVFEPLEDGIVLNVQVGIRLEHTI